MTSTPVFHIGGYHGWKVNFASGGGTREFCAIAVNMGLGSTRMIGRRIIAVPYVPEGYLDSATINGGTVTMSGWAVDRDSQLGAVPIQIFQSVAASPFGALLATPSTSYLRADVNRVLRVVGNHGWRTTFNVSGGIHKLCAYALNIGVAAPNRLLGCTTLTTSLTWTVQTSQMDPMRGGVAALTCRTEQACVMIDNAGGLYRYDGTNWAPMAGPGNGVVLYRIDCLSASFCMATDGLNGWVLNGSSWTSYGIPRQYPFGISVVSCASPTFCIAKSPSNSTVWVFDGASFQPNAGSFPGDLANTSCFDSSHCVDTMGYVFDGTNWSPPAPGLPVGLGGRISCASTSFCVRIDGKTEQTYDGTSWQPAQTIDSAQLADVSCTTSTFCIATDAAGGSVAFNGTSWNATAPVDPSRAVAHDIRCASATFCVATDGYQLMRFDGSTWGVPTLLQDFDGGGPNGLSCASATTCMAIDPSGHMPWVGREARSRDVSPGGTSTTSNSSTSARCTARARP